MSSRMFFAGLRKVEAVIILIFLASAVKGGPQPRLVYPRLLEERAADGAKLVHIHEDLTLSLLRASVAAPTLIVHEFENGTPAVSFIRGEDIDGNLYEDEKHFATVAVRAESDALELDGVIGPRHRIAPAPTMERSVEGHVPHNIYEIEEEIGARYDALLPKRDEAALKRKRRYKRHGRVPEKVTIELFVISDQKHQKHFDKTKALLQYMCVIINSANLRFKDTVAPQVKLLLVGLERSQDTEPYVHGNRKYLHDTQTLHKLRKYVDQKKREYGYPDVVYLMTGRDMYAMDSGVPDTGSKGVASVGGVCTKGRVAIGEDTPGSYDGMHAFTHETAHLLGAAHDGDLPMTHVVPGHPGARGCPFKQGYIMSYINNGPNHHRFSPCSVRQIQLVLKYRGPDCWKVRSKGHKLDGQYAGMLVKPLDLCKYSVPGKTRVTVDSSPAIIQRCKVRCILAGRKSFFRNRPRSYFDLEAHDFTSCGNGKVCVRGICGKKP
ncbi:venom metalloproteinase antarease TserMP_A-like [Amblyomma americanum]